MMAGHKLMQGEIDVVSRLLATATERVPAPEVAIDMAIAMAVAGEVDGAEELLLEIAASRRDDRVARALMGLLDGR